MKRNFRCELTVHEPMRFLEDCGIQKNRVNADELRRVDWIWDNRPEKRPYTKCGVYLGMIVLMTISGQTHSIWLILASAIASIIALELLDRIRRKRLSRWSQAYRAGIQRLLGAVKENE